MASTDDSSLAFARAGARLRQRGSSRRHTREEGCPGEPAAPPRARGRPPRVRDARPEGRDAGGAHARGGQTPARVPGAPPVARRRWARRYRALRRAQPGLASRRQTRPNPPSERTRPHAPKPRRDASDRSHFVAHRSFRTLAEALGRGSTQGHVPVRVRRDEPGAEIAERPARAVLPAGIAGPSRGDGSSRLHRTRRRPAPRHLARERTG